MLQMLCLELSLLLCCSCCLPTLNWPWAMPS